MAARSPAVPGATSGPGLVVYPFGADLFYANAGRFADDLRTLVEGAGAGALAGGRRRRDHRASTTPPRARCATSTTDLTPGVALLLVHVEPSLLADLDGIVCSRPLAAADLREASRCAGGDRRDG